MNILLFANIGTWSNKYYHVGDEAMFLTTLEWYQKEHNDYQISCLTSLPNHQDRNIEEIIHPLPANYYNSKTFLKFIIKLFFLKRFKKNFFNVFEQKILKLIKQQDIIHLTGGGHLNSIYFDWLYYSLSIILISKFFKKKVFITSHSLGPFNIKDLLLSSSVLNKVDKIILREPVNFLTRLKYLLFFTKISGKIDSGYFLKKKPIKIENKNHLRIGISIHKFINNKDQYKNLLEVLDKISKNRKIEILTIPHIITTSEEEHDDYFMNNLVGNLHNIKIIKLSKNLLLKTKGEIAEKINYATSTCDIIITTRYHGLIFSLANSIPCFCLFNDKYYKQKFIGALKFLYKKNQYEKFLVTPNNDKYFYGNFQKVCKDIVKEKHFLSQKNNKLKTNLHFPCNFISCKTNSLSTSIYRKKIHKIFKLFNIFKKLSIYAIFHPQKSLKALYILHTKGYGGLINKYNSIQHIESPKIIKQFSTTKKIFIALYYFVLISIFFIISTFVKYFHLVFSKKINIPKSKKMINGVSFIIPTWNKKDMVLKCVELLDQILSKERQNIKKEIIIIENGSTDGSVQALSRLKTKIPIILLKQKTNIGFAKAINLGLKHSKYNYVYLINNDMEVQKGFFNSLIETANKLLKQSKPFFGISSQIFFFDPTKRREESGKTYSLPNLGFISIAHYVQEKALEEVSFTLYPGGGSSLINKHYLQKIGGYDHKTFTPLYCEDLDAGFIAWKLGLPSYYDPNSHIVHHHRSSSTRLTQDPSYFMYKNWLVLILKDFDSLQNIINHLILYPIKIISSESHAKYAHEALKNINNIFISKIKLYKYKTLNSDKYLTNFPKFETKLNEKK